MVSTLALISILAAAPSGRELWLVRALYPGQELLVGRTEDAIRALMPQDLRSNEVIGHKELEEHLRGKTADMACLLGDARCAEPIGSLVSSLGFSRVVLVKGGQDETGYQFRVATFTASSPDVASAESSGPSLNRALTGALVKVVPLASTLEVATDPPGMTVFVDGERVGQTPLSTQVLPGDRTIRVEGPFYVPLEIKQTFEVRGRATLKPNLERTPARLVVAASPAEAQISVDGQAAGTGRVDRGISAGPHAVRIALNDYESQEISVQAKPGETVTVERALVQGGLAALHKEAYARSWDVIVLAELQNLGSGAAAWSVPPGELQGTLTSGTSLQGLYAEIGSYDNFVGFNLLGLRVAKGTESIGFTDNLGGAPRSLNITRVAATAFQPRLRIHLWRFQAFAQAGLDFQMMLGEDAAGVENPIRMYSLGVSGRAGLRFFPIAGLFLEAGYGARLRVALNEVPLQQGLVGGIGYAF